MGRESQSSEYFCNSFANGSEIDTKVSVPDAKDDRRYYIITCVNKFCVINRGIFAVCTFLHVTFNLLSSLLS